MSKPKYGWWGYVKDICRRWPELAATHESRIERREYEAVCAALADNPPERVQSGAVCWAALRRYSGPLSPRGSVSQRAGNGRRSSFWTWPRTGDCWIDAIIQHEKIRREKPCFSACCEGWGGYPRHPSAAPQRRPAPIYPRRPKRKEGVV